MILQIAAAVVFLIWFVLLRPRKGRQRCATHRHGQSRGSDSGLWRPGRVFQVAQHHGEALRGGLRFRLYHSGESGLEEDGWIGGEQPANGSELELPHRGAGGSFLFGRLKSIVSESNA